MTARAEGPLPIPPPAPPAAYTLQYNSSQSPPERQQGTDRNPVISRLAKREQE
ncbi:hypothetical protein ACFYVL_00800 [Streptomyces sp. NPDC004111]|uniref:hypothetical protein n=1 Tax=Streptomyces sp. NPDC004111 TaxID=3364690 RepID=UPI0036A57F53